MCVLSACSGVLVIMYHAGSLMLYGCVVMSIRLSCIDLHHLKHDGVQAGL